GVVPVTHFPLQGELVIRLDSPVMPPGDYRATLVPEARPDDAISPEIVQTEPLGEGVRRHFRLPLAEVPPGPARLVVSYVEGEQGVVVHDERLLIGRLDAEVRLDEIDRAAGRIRGALHFVDPMPGVRVEAT